MTIPDSRFPKINDRWSQAIHIQDQRHAAVADQGGARIAWQASQGAGQGLITKKVNLATLFEYISMQLAACSRWPVGPRTVMGP
ncbi:hypothetical protein [Xanthomonas campestris]|uniref:hypothetical protein n=1 Tax=Xanthomonas campestris TaxID=339 RepID=UPI002366826A|nr:hypothetical protein [Xanthomonas campestris]WDJ04495.1 hypothetical protein JH261_11375 [Xanthomonas campestris pv. incanae]